MKHETARIDDWIPGQVGQTHGRPIAMGQVDMAEGKGAWNERAISRIELSFNPVRPHPVEIILNGFGVDKAARMEEHTGSQQLEWLGDFGRLGKLSQLGQELDRIDKSVHSRQARD